MRSFRGVCLAVAMLALPRFARAQTEAAPPPPPPEGSAPALTLETVLRSVDGAFPLIDAARREQAVAEADVLSADGAFDPNVRLRGNLSGGGYYEYARGEALVEQPTQLWGASLFAGYRLGRGLSSQGFPDYYGYMETTEGGEVRAGLAIPLVRNGPIDRRRANIRRAELGRPIAAMNLEQATLDARRAATQRYWEWAAAGRRLAVARALLDLATARDAGLVMRVQRGDLPAIERTDNLRAVAQRQGIVVTAQRSLEQAAIELSLYLRDAGGASIHPTPEQLPGELPEPAPLGGPTVRAEVDAAPARRPELRRLAAQRQQFEVEREWARNQTLPAVDVSVAVSQSVGQAPYARVGTNVDAALTVEIPILNRVARGRVNAAEASISRVDAQTRFARDRIGADVRDALSAVDAAVRRTEVARQELRVAREVEAAERARFEMGDGTILTVNLREQASAEAAIREVDARLDFHRAMAAYRAATATPSSGR